MSKQALAYLNSFGIPQAVDSSTMDLSRFRLETLDDLDRLREAAFDEADRLGHPGKLMAAWTEALRRGADDALVDMSAANGSLPRPIGQLGSEVEDAYNSSARVPIKSEMNPQLAAVQLDGQSLADLPVEYSLNRLHGMLVDCDPSQRAMVSQLITDLESTPATAFGSMMIDEPEPLMQVEINSTDEYSSDPYTQWRSNIGDGHGALGSLAIKPSISNDPLFSGITSMNNDGGGVYELNSDWHYFQSVAESGGGDSDE